MVNLLDAMATPEVKTALYRVDGFIRATKEKGLDNAHSRYYAPHAKTGTNFTTDCVKITQAFVAWMNGGGVADMNQPSPVDEVFSLRDALRGPELVEIIKKLKDGRRVRAIELRMIGAMTLSWLLADPFAGKSSEVFDKELDGLIPGGFTSGPTLPNPTVKSLKAVHDELEREELERRAKPKPQVSELKLSRVDSSKYIYVFDPSLVFEVVHIPPTRPDGDWVYEVNDPAIGIRASATAVKYVTRRIKEQLVEMADKFVGTDSAIYAEHQEANRCRLFNRFTKRYLQHDLRSINVDRVHLGDGRVLVSNGPGLKVAVQLENPLALDNPLYAAFVPEWATMAHSGSREGVVNNFHEALGMAWRVYVDGPNLAANPAALRIREELTKTFRVEAKV